MSEEPKSFVAKVKPDYSIKYERRYSNHFMVTHGSLDFHLQFLDVIHPNEFNEDELLDSEKKVISAEVVADIVVPAPLIPSIVNALNENYNKWIRKQNELIKEQEEGKESDE